eukprot:TRINITY_DN14712_c0_g1_i1.p1 TRINITY_DN14712_c0_g1~~TRINITY_DN14712_c0_g1_i1.p1  ORF type:complete len:100 (+),score=5.16 TRINITY_DN14712_c0_g1_i1:23-301(+)
MERISRVPESPSRPKRLLSISELLRVFTGRVMLQKHMSYDLYRPAAFHLAQVITDIPFVFVQVLLFSSISFFMYGWKFLIRTTSSFICLCSS